MMSVQASPRPGVRKEDLKRHVHERKALWNLVAIGYTLIGYVCGIYFAMAESLWVNLGGFLLLSHSLIYSVFVAHELMHGTIFRAWKFNELAGNLMCWLNGGCYFKFLDLTKFHIAHHVDHIDFAAIDLPEYVGRWPAPMRRLALALEWLHIPAVCMVLRFHALVAPFQHEERKQERQRILVMTLIRGTLFAVLGYFSLKALVIYAVAYVVANGAVQFIDALQHTFEVVPLDRAPEEFDEACDYDPSFKERPYERANTFTTLFSHRFWWVNLLIMNFGYHNAHHESMTTPWHNLHKLDRDLYGQGTPNHIPLRQLLANYHRFRVERIFTGQGTALDANGQRTFDTFYGAAALPFLIAPGDIQKWEDYKGILARRDVVEANPATAELAASAA